jgi:hypothetical protein
MVNRVREVGTLTFRLVPVVLEGSAPSRVSLLYLISEEVFLITLYRFGHVNLFIKRGKSLFRG